MKKSSYIFILISALLIFITIQPAFAESQVLATLNGQNITDTEIDALAKPRMTKLLSQMYEIKRDAIDQIIDDRLISEDAKKQNLTVDKLKKKIMEKAGDVSENEAKTIYQLQKKRFQDKTFDEVKPQLLAQLTNQKKQMAVNDYLDELRSKAKIKINIERPRAQVSADDDPSMGGGKDAPIQLIEFSEFQCPFCKRARPTIAKILETYGDKVHYVFRDFPLSFHNQAKDAANAANCANEQGKYWDFSNELWERQGKHTDEELVKIAETINLNMDKFNKCVSDKKYYDEIDKDQDDGVEVGVTGTPAYFINGLFLSGAQPFESFKALIDEELENKK